MDPGVPWDTLHCHCQIQQRATRWDDPITGSHGLDTHSGSSSGEQEKPLRIPNMHTCAPQGTVAGFLQRRARWPGSHCQQQAQLIKKMFASFPVLPCPYISTLQELKVEETKIRVGIHPPPKHTLQLPQSTRKAYWRVRKRNEVDLGYETWI